MVYEHPVYTPGVGRRAAPAARAERRPSPPSPAPTTAGASTRTAAAPGSRPPSARGRLVTRHLATGPRTTPTIAHVRTDAGAARASPPDATCGWSTSTTCRGCPALLRPFARLRRPRPPRRPGADHPREPRRLPGRARRRPGRRAGADARPRPGARPRVQPADRLLVPRPRRRARAASSPRCTTPTASGTATCCAPTPPDRATSAKEFYVSPFLPVDGDYRMRAARTRRAARRDHRAARDGGDRRSPPPCAATRRPADARGRAARRAARTRWSTLRASAPDPPARHRAVPAPACPSVPGPSTAPQEGVR